MFYMPMRIRHRGPADVLIYELCYILVSYSIFRIALPDLECSYYAWDPMRCYNFKIFVIRMLHSCLLFVDLWQNYVWPRLNWPRWRLAWILDVQPINTAGNLFNLDTFIALVMICVGSILEGLFPEGGYTLRVVVIENFYFGGFLLARSISMWIPVFFAIFLQILITESLLASIIIILGVSAIFLIFYK